MLDQWCLSDWGRSWDLISIWSVQWVEWRLPRIDGVLGSTKGSEGAADPQKSEKGDQGEAAESEEGLRRSEELPMESQTVGIPEFQSNSSTQGFENPLFSHWRRLQSDPQKSE